MYSENSHLRTQSLAWTSLKKFCGRLVPALMPWAQEGTDAGLPCPQLVVRVGVAGHLCLRGADEIERVTREVLKQVQDTCAYFEDEFARSFQTAPEGQPKACCRFFSSLAAGADQLAARVAHDLKYEIQAVLPANREAFQEDIRKNICKEGPPDGFADLLPLCSSVFELDGDLSSNPPGTHAARNRAYAEAAEVVLAHSDILLVVMSSHADAHHGGTLWLVRKASDLNMPIIMIPAEEPAKTQVTWFDDGKPLRAFLFTAQPDEDPLSLFKGILRPLLLPPQASHKLPDSGHLEQAYRQRLDPARNAEFWDNRWNSGVPTESATHGAQIAKTRIDEDFRRFAVWADHRASAYGEMYRGAVTLSTLLGAVAVSLALLSILWDRLSTAGKFSELVILAILVALYRRATRFAWKERWLNYRRLERHLNAAAWLALLGRTVRIHVPAHGSFFHERAAWENWCTRAILRQASLPSVRIDRQYLNTVCELFLNGLVRDQKAFYLEEVKEHSYTDERLQHVTLRFLHLAIASTVAYLVFHLLVDTRIFNLLPGLRSVRAAVECMIAKREGGNEWVGMIRRVATVLGAGLPAWAAAFSALRSQGEHTQIAARYGGQITALAGIEREFERLIDIPSLSNPIRAQEPEWGSGELTTLATKVTAMLTDEVHHWHSMLLTKEIERP